MEQFFSNDVQGWVWLVLGIAITSSIYTFFAFTKNVFEWFNKKRNTSPSFKKEDGDSANFFLSFFKEIFPLRVIIGFIIAGISSFVFLTGAFGWKAAMLIMAIAGK